MRFRRRPFDDLVERQLALFVEDEADLLDEAADAEAAWARSGRAEAEESYGDFQLVVDAISDRLLEIREAFTATLDDAGAEAYRDTFHRAAARRFRRYASLVADLEP